MSKIDGFLLLLREDFQFPITFLCPMIGWIITESNLKTERKNINSLRFYKRFSKVIDVTPLIEVTPSYGIINKKPLIF